jgi:RNA recognition motif-containing protein
MKNLFRANLNCSVTEAALRSLFEAYGPVASVNIVRDRDSGQPRGFGFVEMTNNAEAAKAIDGLNGKDVEGRTLNVNEAHPKAERPARGGGYERKRW